MATENKSLAEVIDADGDGIVQMEELQLFFNTDGKLTREEATVMFQAVDADKTGGLTIEEVCQVLGCEADAVREAFEHADTDGDGTIDLEEFLACLKVTRTIHDVQVEAQFAAMDVNNDGFLSMEEVAAGAGVPMTFVEPIFKAADTNGDGKLSLEETKAMLAKADKNGDGVIDEDEALEMAFDALDTNGDGLLDASEIAAAMNVDEAAVQPMIDQMDKDGDGQVSLEEVKATMREKKRDAVQAQFEAVDTDGDGFISIDEMAAATGCSVEQVKPMFDIVDTDGDGQLSLAEAQAALAPQKH